MRHLFSSGYLSEVLREKKRKMNDRVDQFQDDEIANLDFMATIEALYDEFSIDPPRVLTDKADIDAPSHSSMAGENSTWTIHVPAEGEIDLLWKRANSFTLNPTYGDILGNELVIPIEKTPYDDDTRFGQRIKNALDNIQKEVGWTYTQVVEYNDEIRKEAASIIETRRGRLKRIKDIGSKLPIKMRRREGAPTTYSPSVVKRKIQTRAPVTNGSKPNDPSLSMDEYENILQIISSMAEVMERSPKAFTKIGEEDLRTHFLVQLNGQYEGQATGETFNLEGDTDILVKDQGKAIFIAECKYWGGKEKHKATIDQLLGYLSWRDTKAAILVFNRNKDFSNVIRQMLEATKEHPNYLRMIGGFEQENGFRCAIKNKNDNEREIILTVMAFDVPVQ